MASRLSASALVACWSVVLVAVVVVSVSAASVAAALDRPVGDPASGAGGVPSEETVMTGVTEALTTKMASATASARRAQCIG
jgi:hypothetical protein